MFYFVYGERISPMEGLGMLMISASVFCVGIEDNTSKKNKVMTGDESLYLVISIVWTCFAGFLLSLNSWLVKYFV
jgi:hypothetical protein